MNRRNALGLALLVAFLSVSASVVIAEQTASLDILERQAIQTASFSQEKMFFYERTQIVEEAFKTAINIEWPPALNRAGNERDLPAITVQKGMPLHEALDLITGDLEDFIEWKVIKGALCLIPKGIPPTPMDLLISYKVEDASAWDAVKELVRIVNAEAEKGTIERPVTIDLSCMGSCLRPPAAFKDTRQISLALENMTVRDVFCEILRLSRVNMRYSYAQYDPADRFSIHFWGKDYVNRFDEPDLKERLPVLEWWEDEINSANPPSLPQYRRSPDIGNAR